MKMHSQQLFYLIFNIFRMHSIFFSDHDTRIWSFDLSVYEEVQKKVSALNPEIVIGSMPQFVLKLLRQGKSYDRNRTKKNQLKMNQNI